MPRNGPIGTSTVELLQGREPDQRGDDAAGQSGLGPPGEHARELVGDEDDEQHAGHGHEGQHDFAKQVSV